MQTALILGATGYIGQGAALNFLKHGYTVVAQSREQAKLEVLRASLVKHGADVSKLHFVTGSLDSGSQAEAVGAAVQQLLGGPPQHVVSSLGFALPVPGLASAASPETIAQSFEGSVWPNIRAANVFVPLQRGKRGTFLQVSGGLAHGVKMPRLWAGTLKHATLSSWGQVLAAELKDDPLRFVGVCVHFGVAALGLSKNQFGFPSVGTERLGAVFPALAAGESAQRGMLCLGKIEEVEALVGTRV